MGIIERIKAKESRFGRFLIREGTIIMGLLAAFSHAGLDQSIATKLMALPSDWVPPFVKWIFSVLTFLSPIAGKLTVGKDEGDGQNKS